MILAEKYFFSDIFQEKWKKYRKAFGKDLDKLFGDDFDKKIRLCEGLEHLLNNELSEAYHVIRHLEFACQTDADKLIFNRLIRLCLNEEEMSKAKVGDWVKQSSRGYYQIIKRTPTYAVIKRAFDHKNVYAKQSINIDGFTIELTDLKTYQFVEKEDLRKIKNFFAENPDEQTEFLRHTDTMLALREKILSANFQEAEWEFRRFNFYRCTSEKVAFIVNLTDYGSHIDVTYGFTSIVEQNYLKNYGEDNENIKIRFRSKIVSEQDKFAVADQVKKVYDTYVGKSKDEILSLKKERQKQFVQKITDKLKPLGFKKKSIRWTKPLAEDIYLQFEASKSQWSDVYRFYVSIYVQTLGVYNCFDTQLWTNTTYNYNWQLMTDDELNCVLDGVIQDWLLPIMNTPLAELGRQQKIWKRCACKRTKCDNCWVQKNMWEAQQN